MSSDDIVRKIESAEVLYFPGKRGNDGDGAKRAPDVAGAAGHTGAAAGGDAATERAQPSAFPSPADAGSPGAADPPAAAGAAASEKSSRTGGFADFAGASSGEGGGDDGRDGADGGDLDRRCAFLPLTDLGNAERFRTRYGRKFRYCEALGWLAWDGRRWNREQAEGLVKLSEHDCVRAIQDEAEAARGSALDYIVETKRNGDIVMFSDKIAGWGRASESANRLGSISKRAAPMLQISTDALDADPMRFNVLNGTLVLSRAIEAGYVRLDPHDPADLITKLAPVVYDPAAVCPQYDAFLARVQPTPQGDGANQGSATPLRFLHQWAGLSLTGETGEQRYTFHYGKGRNGKGVWVSTVAHVLGDYGTSIRIESFLDSGRAQAGGQATPDLAKLPGVRFLTTSEPKKGATLDEGLIKLFTGEDTISARFLNKEFFEFRPAAKLTMQGNYRPKISGTDEGIWNRTILVPWPVFIPKEERDMKLAHKLRAEASGILNRFLDGLRDWLDHGLILPDSVIAATDEYRSDSDPLGRFLEACTTPQIGKRVQSSDMHAVYEAWAKANGEAAWTAKGLAMALKERGVASKKSVNVFWLDIALTKGVGDFIGADGKILRSGEAGSAGVDGDGWEKVYDD